MAPLAVVILVKLSVTDPVPAITAPAVSGDNLAEGLTNFSDAKAPDKGLDAEQ